jgi:WD40 repeat protein
MTTDINSRPIPYVGPRAFETGEKLYGRDRETRELLDHLIAERIVVFYSPSGAGKTSLIRAGLIPQLQEEGFYVLPVVRVNLEPPTAQVELNPPNRYIFSALISLEEDLPLELQTPVEKLASMTLADYLSQRQLPPGQDGNHADQLLLFDQFEEILTVDHTDQDGKMEFFAQVGAALRTHQRWALFIIREDYVAALDPYLRPIPTRLSNRFRLDLLDIKAASQAIQQPAREAGVDFNADATQKLVNDLRRVQVQQLDGSMKELPGPYVEPVQLQVVCYRLWQNLAGDQTQITEKDLEAVGDVDQSLSEYYAERVAQAAQQTGVSERAIRDWFGEKLITEQGIRSQVLMGVDASDGLDNRAIRLLENAHLVRSEKRRAATWFELAHDRLINPVRNNNEAWYQANLSLLQHQAALWQKDGRPDHLLLREQAFEQAEAWAVDHQDQLTTIERDFLDACTEAREREMADRLRQEQEVQLREQERHAKKLRQRFIVATLAAIIALVFGVSALYFADSARRASAANAALAQTNQVYGDYNAMVASTANAASTQAIDQQHIALTAQAQEASQRREAEDARATAIAAADEAEAARATAIYNADLAEANAEEAEVNAEQARQQAALATSRRLASQAQNNLIRQPDLAALLAVEAWFTSDTLEARGALLRILQISTSRSVTHFGPQLPVQERDLFSVALSPDGEHLAWGTSDGKVILWNYQTRQPAWSEPGDRHGPNRVSALAFSPNGELLASGAFDGRLIIWNVATQEARVIQNRNNIFSLAFSPDGRRLAASVASQILIWDTETWEATREPFDFLARVNGLDWSPTSDRLVIVGEGNSVGIWDPRTDILSNRFTHHQQGIASVAWSPNGNLVASASRDGNIIIWDVARGNQDGEALRTGQFTWFNSISFSSDGKYLVSGDSESNVIVWDVARRSIIDRLSFHDEPVQMVAFSPRPGQALFASVSLDNRIGLHTVSSLQPLSREIARFDGPPLSLQVRPDGALLAAVQSPNQLILYAINQDAQETLHTATGVFQAAALSADGSMLALAGRNNVFQLWRVEGRSLQTELRAFPAFALAFDNQQETALAVAQCQTVTDLANLPETCSASLIRLWDPETDLANSQQFESPSNFLRSLAINPLNGWIASAGDDQTILFWNRETAQREGLPLSRHAASVVAMAFNSTGDLLASGSADQALILWDMDTRQVIGEPLIGSPDTITSLAFSQDGLRLFSGSSDGAIIVWDIDLASWVDQVCQIAGRNLNPDEWKQFMGEAEFRLTCP